MNLTDTRIAQGGCEKLDLAILSFFEQFRKIYVGDQVHKMSKVSNKYLYIPRPMFQLEFEIFGAIASFIKIYSGHSFIIKLIFIKFFRTI